MHPEKNQQTRQQDPRAGDLGRWQQKAASLEDRDLAHRALNVLENPEQKNLLARVFSHSPFLSAGLLAEMDLACRLLEGGFVPAFTKEIAALEGEGREEKAGTLMRTLRQSRRRVSTLIALAEITEFWPHQTVTQNLSRFADACMRQSFRHVLGEEEGSGLAIIALGKWGAEELNYSSDIDFIAVFDSARAMEPDKDILPQRYLKATRDIVRLLEERTEDGYVFRTDLRLRPDAMPVAFSLTAAEVYYGSLGQNWERAAMIKARPVAGDPKVADDFMRLMQSWIWRKSLDFATIQDIHSIKRQISSRTGTPDDLKGYNVKLGHGGIREIEFFVQTQQLIYGGREPDLRSRKTLDMLGALKAHNRLSDGDCRDLQEAYIFLRTVEHRLQMVQDQQTHELPVTEEGFAAISGFLGFDSVAAFSAVLKKHVATVRKNYAALFEEAPSLAGPGNLVFTGTEDDPETLKTLAGMGFQESSRAAGLIRGWHHGRYRATRSNRARQILTELIPALLAALAETPRPDEAFLRFDAFLQALPSGVPLFSMFQQNPELMTLVADIMGSAPRLAVHLGNHPDVLESVLSRDIFSALPDRKTLEKDLDHILSTARHYEEALNIIRRWARDKRFQAGLHILKGLTVAEDCGPFLSDVAEVSLLALLPHVEADFARNHGRFKDGGLCLIALGRLGSREMTVASDLDLVAVYEAPKNPDAESDGAKSLAASSYYVRLTQRLITALTALTEEGILYDVDMRLRPSGNKGPLAVSVEAFRNYQENDAWTWEHLSLCRARVIYGPPDTRGTLAGIIRGVLAQPRDAEKLKAAVLDMRQKMVQEFGTDSFDVRNRRGGLIDLSFILQYFQLACAADYPDILTPGTREALARLVAVKCLKRKEAEALERLFVVATRVQALQRLCGEDAVTPDLKKGLDKTARSVEGIFGRLFG